MRLLIAHQTLKGGEVQMPANRWVAVAALLQRYPRYLPITNKISLAVSAVEPEQHVRIPLTAPEIGVLALLPEPT